MDTGKVLQRNGYKIKILNTINFKKSMKYNPFAYIHSEKDILKLVTALISNTRGDGKGGDPFWEKAETLLYTALIGYIHYEAPEEEQNFSMQRRMRDKRSKCNNGGKSKFPRASGLCRSLWGLVGSGFTPSAKGYFCRFTCISGA